jgi:transposase
MRLAADSLPTDLAAAHAMIIAQHEALLAAEARASAAESEAKFRALLIEKLKYTIAKLRHEKFGQSSERGAILEQLELSLAELQADAAQAETAAQLAAEHAKDLPSGPDPRVTVRSFVRRQPARRPLPAHLPRERIVYSGTDRRAPFRVRRMDAWSRRPIRSCAGASDRRRKHALGRDGRNCQRS